MHACMHAYIHTYIYIYIYIYIGRFAFESCDMGAAGALPQSLTGKTHAALARLDITCGTAALMLGVPPQVIDISWVSPQVVPCDTDYGQEPLGHDVVGPVPRTLLRTWCWMASHCQAANSV